MNCSEPAVFVTAKMSDTELVFAHLSVSNFAFPCLILSVAPAFFFSEPDYTAHLYQILEIW
jgi:hypothetical protein